MEPQKFWDHDLDLFGSRDVIDHLTTGLVSYIGGLLYVSYRNQRDVSHDCLDMLRQTFCYKHIPFVLIRFLGQNGGL